MLALATLLLLARLVSAHSTLSYPAWRGDSFAGDASQWCADLTFSATAAALPASSCQNSTGVGGVAIANVAANANGPATAMNTTAAVQTGGAGRDVVGAGRVLGPFAAAAAAVVAVGLL